MLAPVTPKSFDYTVQPASNPSTEQIWAQLSIASDVPAHVHLDVNRFRVLLRNLLLNAWRYGHGWEIPPEVDLTWLADASPTDLIVLVPENQVGWA
jgi:hypothetical protein